jgi:hypothetical protein
MIDVMKVECDRGGRGRGGEEANILCHDLTALAISLYNLVNIELPRSLKNYLHSISAQMDLGSCETRRARKS